MRICEFIAIVIHDFPVFSMTAPPQMTIEAEPKVNYLDPKVAKIMEILNKSLEFHTLLDKNPKLQQKVKIHALTFEDCQIQGIKNAKFTYTPATMFFNEIIDIYFDSSLPLCRQVRGVLIEYCNTIFVEDYAKLDRLVIEGRLDKERYIYFKEQVEWNASHQAFKIAEAIDALNLFDNETIFSAMGSLANQNFDLYLQIQAASGHSSKYGEIWDSINERY
jgi:hypothetical protein